MEVFFFFEEFTYFVNVKSKYYFIKMKNLGIKRNLIQQNIVSLIFMVKLQSNQMAKLPASNSVLKNAKSVFPHVKTYLVTVIIKGS